MITYEYKNNYKNFFENIKSNEIQLISQDGQSRIMEPRLAKNIAAASESDLVEVDSKAVLPILRMTNSSLFQTEAWNLV
jgi:translation initiation factor IF-3